MSQKKTLRACAAQISPVFMDKKASVEKYAQTLVEAGKQGVDLIVTPETGIPAYPYWRNNFGYTDPESAKAWKETVVAFYDQAVRIPGPETEELGRAARSAGLTAVIGLNEQDDRPGSRTLYNTMLFLGPDGAILGRHRKLMPTHQERIFWGRGDAADLRVFDTPFGRLGGLICFENHMTLLKAAMAVKGEEIHAACWPGYWAYGGPGNTVRDMTGTRYPLHHSDQDAAVREYAFETQTFVVSASLFLGEDQVPDDFPYKATTNWKWAMGGSAIATPFGTYAAEPLFGKEGLVIADLDLADRIVAKNVFDCMGHYSRWDVVRLQINRQPAGPEVSPEASGPEADGSAADDPEDGENPLAKLPLLARLSAMATAAAAAAGAEDPDGESPPPKAIIGALPANLAKPFLGALMEKFGPDAVSAHRAELDGDDLEELARSHGLSHDEVVSLIHDFLDLIRRRSELVVPDLDSEEPADA